VTLHLDDDTCAGLLVAMFRKAGHDVIFPADVGMSGEHDAAHLLRSVVEGRVFVSHNYKDFEHLHNLVVGCSGSHRGVVLIRRDNDRRKVMTNKNVVAAIGRVGQAYPDLTNELITLNDWR
jgi:succinate dehydrogenase/fumarate reductase flavoprotein subunit